MSNHQVHHSIHTARIVDSDEQKEETVSPAPSQVSEETEENDICDDEHGDLLGTSTTRPKRKVTVVA